MKLIKTPRAMRSISMSVVALLSASQLGTVNAQEKSSEDLEEITVVAKTSAYSVIKTDTPILETARSISIETEQDLLNMGALELADAYTYSAGVTGETFGFATRGDYVRVRGLDVPQYQDSLQSLFGNFNNTRPEVYTLEQVEILKGPASVLYGQGSPGGIVNVVSKLPVNHEKNEIVASFGSHDYQQLGVDLGGAIDQAGHWLYRFVGLKRETDTQVDYISDDALVIAPSLTYAPSEDTQITVLLNYQDSKADPGAQFLPVVGTLLPAQNGQFIDSDFFAGEPGFNNYDGKTESITLLADHQINDVWGMQLTARHTEGERDYEQAWVSFSFSADRFVRNADGSLYEGGSVPRSFYQSAATSEQDAIDLRFRASFDTGAVEHQLMMGAQLQDVTTDDDFTYLYGIGYDFTTGGPDATVGDTFWINVFDPSYGAVPPQSVFDANLVDGQEVNIKDLGLYINDQMTLGALHLNLGLRIDDTENRVGTSLQEDDATSIAAGLLYQFENGLSPYISYAESFEPIVGIDAVTGASFKPQEGEQVEAGIKYELPGSVGLITMAYFDIEQSNLLTSTPIGQTQIGGIDTVKGWELEAKFRFSEFSLEANISDLETETDAGFQFPSVPESQASAWLGYGQYRETGFRAGLGARYVGESFGGADTIETPSYTLLDAMIGFKMENWMFQLNARNLADEEYQATCLIRGDCFQGERRTIVGTARYNF
ncbi:TonB-dependent siderophore receptor [Arenicella sp. 4NH20-0111]|uniref:TonB-dependent siderophore receptor n=1 Tax=Arenicella sp. 4NH20-0111 TaxID=3127648 RepID=UPI003108F37C